MNNIVINYQHCNKIIHVNLPSFLAWLWNKFSQLMSPLPGTNQCWCHMRNHGHDPCRFWTLDPETPYPLGHSSLLNIFLTLRWYLLHFWCLNFASPYRSNKWLLDHKSIASINSGQTFPFCKSQLPVLVRLLSVVQPSFHINFPWSLVLLY